MWSGVNSVQPLDHAKFRDAAARKGSSHATAQLLQVGVVVLHLPLISMIQRSTAPNG